MGWFVGCPKFVTHLEGENTNSKKRPTFQDSVPHFRTEHQFPSFDFSGPGWSWSILVGPDWPWLVSGHLGLVLEGIGTPGTPWNTLKHPVQSCPEMWDTLDLNWCPTFQDLVYYEHFGVLQMPVLPWPVPQ